MDMNALSLEVDAHAWVRELKLEYYRVATLRCLKVGDVFWVGCFDGPGVTANVMGRCEAFIERVRGGYRYCAFWTIQASAKTRRAHVMTSGKFNLLKGNVIRFASLRDVAAAKSFKLVCRYVRFVDQHDKELGYKPFTGAPEHRSTIWRCETVFASGFTRFGVEGPESKGFRSIVETAIALGVVRDDGEPDADVNVGDPTVMPTEAMGSGSSAGAGMFDDVQKKAIESVTKAFARSKAAGLSLDVFRGRAALFMPPREQSLAVDAVGRAVARALKAQVEVRIDDESPLVVNLAKPETSAERVAY